MLHELSYTAALDEDLPGILALQQANLKQFLPPGELSEQGFVTVQHNFPLLKNLNDAERHIIAKHDNRVVGYTLAMTRQARAHIPVLVSLFDQADTIHYDGRMLGSYQYLVVGQACVDKAYRGMKVLDRCYEVYRERYQGKYQMAITDIVSSNTRSRRVHQRVGFKEVKTFTDAGGTEWVIVVWDWR